MDVNSGTASGTVVNGGGHEEIVGGTDIGAVVNSGGTEIVSSGGSVVIPTISGGFMECASGANVDPEGVYLQGHGGTLKLDQPSAFSPNLRIVGLAAGDIIDLGNTSAVKTAVVSGTTLTVTEFNNQVLTFQLGSPDPTIRFAIQPDGTGGTNLTVSDASTLNSDFTGHGSSDILFRNNTTGDGGFYQISNGTLQGWQGIGGSSTAYLYRGRRRRFQW
jgi:autotransporter passenger strand-loop-strand repeat protein